MPLNLNSNERALEDVLSHAKERGYSIAIRKVSGHVVSGRFVEHGDAYFVVETRKTAVIVLSHQIEDIWFHEPLTQEQLEALAAGEKIEMPPAKLWDDLLPGVRRR